MSVKQAFKGSAVTGFVFAHFMNGIMDGVKAESFGFFGNVEFALAGAVFSFNPELKILFRIGIDYFAQEFSEFGSMLSFFKSNALISFSNFRVAFAVSLAAHSQVHANFGALTHEIHF